MIEALLTGGARIDRAMLMFMVSVYSGAPSSDYEAMGVFGILLGS